MSWAAWAHSTSPALAFLGSDASQDELIEAMRSTRPTAMRQVGSTSVTLRLELGERDAAFKPRSRSHRNGHHAEVAAYEIARHLGFDNVPPAISRRFERDLLRRQISQRQGADWEAFRSRVLWDSDGQVTGTAIYWIPDLTASELDRLDGLEGYLPMLRAEGPAPQESRALSEDLSNMIAFDFLIGNWDRFSGGNVSSNRQNTRLYIRDHNVAFQPLTPNLYRRIRANLQRIERFSRNTVIQASRLNRERLQMMLGTERTGGPLVNPAQLNALTKRQQTFMSYIAALIALHGESAILYFP